MMMPGAAADPPHEAAGLEVAVAAQIEDIAILAGQYRVDAEVLRNLVQRHVVVAQAAAT